MDVFVIILIFVISISLVIVLWANQFTHALPFLGGMVISTTVPMSDSLTYQGGKVKHTEDELDLNSKKLILPDNVKFIFDGHNLIHQLHGTSLSVMEFKEALKNISRIITQALPGGQLHIVLKNPNEEQTKKFNEQFTQVDNDDKTTSIKKPKKNINLYFNELKTLSTEFPNITYHLAYGKEPKSKTKLPPEKHHMKGRDDFLSLYLSKDGYIVSHDRFRDFSKFHDIKPFYHFSTTNGKASKKERINPKTFFENLEEPTLGTHLTYKFITSTDAKKDKITNGDVYVDKTGTNSCLYLIV
jgi:hypothetical protein